ncbi:MAG: acetyl-CoA C-acyltransferase [Myxococcales bacterium]|nr:acetyl-CoA C-acyltransferase [Myxococcales bacterium]
MSPHDVVILSAQRTPIGSFLGALSSISAPKLGSIAAKSAIDRAGIQPEHIEEVYVGCVLPAGLGQAPARQVALAAGLPDSTPCTTINKVCGSGLKTVMMAATQIRAGEADVILAGGIESMSNCPYYIKGARTGLRLGNTGLIDGLITDGLWDVYNDYHMGNAAELCAKEMGISREAQDEFAVESYRRARAAQDADMFANEIVPVEVLQRKRESIVVSRDEEPERGHPEKFAALRPAFDAEGTVTAANASSLNDGAAMVVLSSRRFAEQHGLVPMAVLVHQGSSAQAPEWFTTAPALAIRKTLARGELMVNDVDLFEVNEAFSVVSIANEQLLKLDRKKVNIRGGAVALGHPIGASGARIFTTLLHAMESEGAKRGLASLCIGGGEGVAVVVERV